MVMIRLVPVACIRALRRVEGSVTRLHAYETALSSQKSFPALDLFAVHATSWATRQLQGEAKSVAGLRVDWPGKSLETVSNMAFSAVRFVLRMNAVKCVQSLNIAVTCLIQQARSVRAH
jgi:hypothetical protein